LTSPQKIRTGKAGRSARQTLEVDLGRETQMARKDTQYAFAPAPVRERHHNLPVEASWTQQLPVEERYNMSRADLLVDP
jgi:hypothetical protein